MTDASDPESWTWRTWLLTGAMLVLAALVVLYLRRYGA